MSALFGSNIHRRQAVDWLDVVDGFYCCYKDGAAAEREVEDEGERELVSSLSTQQMSKLIGRLEQPPVCTARTFCAGLVPPTLFH